MWVQFWTVIGVLGALYIWSEWRRDHHGFQEDSETESP